MMIRQGARMPRASVLLIIILLSVISMQAAEPLAGRWLLVSQVVGSQKKPGPDGRRFLQQPYPQHG
jgi:hypothetical protein